MREDGAARDRDSHIVILHAVAVLGVVDDGEPILASRAPAGKVDPALPGIFVAFRLAHLVPVGNFVSGPGILHIHRERELQDFQVLVPIERHARLEGPGAGVEQPVGLQEKTNP